MIVVDASTLVEALLRVDERGERCRATLEVRRQIVVPHHFRIEVANAIRGQFLGGLITEAKGRTALQELARFKARIPRKPAQQFDRIWELRHNLTAYDAAYVALAEALDAPLLTTDARLARTSGHEARIELPPV